MLRDSLEGVVTVAKHNSFAKAAKELYLSTPAITQRINAIEDELGFKIFIRSNKGAFPTAAGEAFIIDAERLIADLNSSVERCLAISEKEKSQLSIGVYESLNNYLLPRICNSFYDKYDDTVLTFVAIKDLTSALLHGLVDIIISYGNVGIPFPGAKNTTLLVDECVCYMSSSHRLADNKYIRLQDLLNEKVIMPPLDVSEYHRSLYSEMKKKSASSNVVIEKSMSVGRLKASLSNYIAIAPRSLHLENADIICIPFESYPYISIDAITRDEPQGLIKEFVSTAENVLRSMNDLL